MFYWTSFPFVRLTIPFILGIVAFQWLNEEVILYQLVGFFCFTLSLFLFNHWFNHAFSLRWVSGACINVLLFLFGIGYTYLFSNQSLPPKLNPSQTIEWFAEVDEVVKKESGVKELLVNVKKLKIDSVWRETNFNLLVANKDSTLKIYAGDLIVAKGKLLEPRKPNNPAQFDYKKFLQRKSIYLATSEDEYNVSKGTFSMSRWPLLAREKIIETYESIGIHNNELAVLVALTLGDKSLLNYKVKQEYAGVGAMHILAVSGLHVGIIFLIFNSLLKVFPNKKFFNYLKGVILLLIIWLFAILAGFSPSVQRASWMFSFIIVSKALQKNTNVLNSIAVSAFLLMLINPNVLFQLGFSLSYSAVIGIILIYPMVYRLYTSKYKVVNKIWALLVVSFSAQLATLPFTLFYFHQFPNYFLLTNLFVIPLAFIVVAGAIVITVLKLTFNVDFYLGELLNKVLQLLNYGIEQISLIPYAVTKGVWIQPFTFYICFLMIGFLIYFIHSTKKSHLFISLSILLLILSFESYIKYQQLGKKQFTVYAASTQAMSYVNGLKGKIYISDKANKYDFKLIETHLSSMGVKEIEWIEVADSTENKVIAVNDKIAVLNPTKLYLKQATKAADFIILNKKYNGEFKSNNTLVIDYNYPKQNGFENKEIYFLKSDGAYSLEM